MEIHKKEGGEDGEVVPVEVEVHVDQHLPSFRESNQRLRTHVTSQDAPVCQSLSECAILDPCLRLQALGFALLEG